jgi:hypothetical protein
MYQNDDEMNALEEYKEQARFKSFGYLIIS